MSITRENPWMLIAEYVPAHPQTFTLLAQINKQAYSVFMSDWLWRKLDFYNVNTDIARHYLEASKQFTKKEKYALRHKHFGDFKPQKHCCHYSCYTLVTESECYYCGDYKPVACYAHWGFRHECNHCKAICEHANSPNLYVAFLVSVNHPKISFGIPKNSKILRVLVHEHGLTEYFKTPAT